MFFLTTTLYLNSVALKCGKKKKNINYCVSRVVVVIVVVCSAIQVNFINLIVATTTQTLG